jgi:hypothetical protein
MKPEAIEILRQVIENWKNQKQYTHEHKQVIAHVNPAVAEEGVLRFSNALYGFYCKDRNMEIYLASPVFFTYCLSENSLSKNINGDKLRLEKHLKDFDEAFYKKVEDKANDCIDALMIATPFFF